MRYQTILVHVDHSRHAEARIRCAAELAVALQAHLVGSAMSGISRFLYQDGGVDVARTVLAGHMDALYAHAGTALDAFERAAAAAGVSSYERRLIDDDPVGGLALQANYADLVVLSQPDPDDPVTRILPGLPGQVMLNCARPVLVLPHAGPLATLGTRVLVAWDGGIGASRAVRDALPLLRRAAGVTLVVLNPSAAHGPQPGADIALYLARHGVHVALQCGAAERDVGAALLSMAADRDCDLLVMGAYGHTRLREVLLGGVTETVLQTMRLPVLLSH